MDFCSEHETSTHSYFSWESTQSRLQEAEYSSFFSELLPNRMEKKDDEVLILHSSDYFDWETNLNGNTYRTEGPIPRSTDASLLQKRVFEIGFGGEESTTSYDQISEIHNIKENFNKPHALDNVLSNKLQLHISKNVVIEEPDTHPQSPSEDQANSTMNLRKRISNEPCKSPTTIQTRSPSANTNTSTIDSKTAALVALNMIEEDCLNEGAVEKLSVEDRSFIANIVFLRTEGKFIDPSLPTKDFVARINKVLFTKDVRKDNLLRWIYKKTLINLLSEFGYEKTKNHQQVTYLGSLRGKYFPSSDKDLENVLGDTSYASKKKLRSLFSQSPAFAKRFSQYVNRQATSEEAFLKYQRMHSFCIEYLNENPKHLKKPFIKSKYTVLPYRGSLVREAISLINSIYAFKI